jgi:hypothetical protein
MLIQCSGRTDAEKRLAKGQTASGVAAAEGDTSAHNYWAAQAASDYQYYIQYSGGAIDFPTPAPKAPKVTVKKSQSLQSTAMGAAGKVVGAIGDFFHGAVGTDSAYAESVRGGNGFFGAAEGSSPIRSGINPSVDESMTAAAFARPGGGMISMEEAIDRAINFVGIDGDVMTTPKGNIMSRG